MQQCMQIMISGMKYLVDEQNREVIDLYHIFTVVLKGKSLSLKENDLFRGWIDLWSQLIWEILLCVCYIYIYPI